MMNVIYLEIDGELKKCRISDSYATIMKGLTQSINSLNRKTISEAKKIHGIRDLLCKKIVTDGDYCEVENI